MNVVIQEWKLGLKSTLIWGFALLITMPLMMTEFTVYYQDAELLAILNTIPESVLVAFGMYGADLSTLGGYISMMALYIYLTLGIHAALAGNGILAKEERDKTAEFIMTMPIKRTQIISYKAMVVMANCLFLNLVTGLSLYLSTTRFTREEGFLRFFFLVFLATLLMQLFFLCLGLFLATAVSRYKVSGGMALWVLFVLYLASVLAALSDQLSWLKHLSIFSYFESNALLRTQQIDAVYVGVTLLMSMTLLLGSYYFYPRRDLRL